MRDYEELVALLRKKYDKAPMVMEAADAIEELQRICNAMKHKHDAVCVKCAYYAEAKYNDKGFLICPASGMDITALDFCSYFTLPEPPKEE